MINEEHLVRMNFNRHLLPLAVYIESQQVGPTISMNDPIWVGHGDDHDDELLFQEWNQRGLFHEFIDHAFSDEGARCLGGVLTSNHNDWLVTFWVSSLESVNWVSTERSPNRSKIGLFCHQILQFGKRIRRGQCKVNSLMGPDRVLKLQGMAKCHVLPSQVIVWIAANWPVASLPSQLSESELIQTEVADSDLTDARDRPFVVIHDDETGFDFLKIGVENSKIEPLVEPDCICIVWKY